MDKYSFIDLIFPQKCMFCGRVIQRDTLCEYCKSRVENSRIISNKINEKYIKSLDECRAFYYYEDIVKIGVHHAKFKNCESFIRDFTKYMDFDLKNFFKENEIHEIISMPFHKSKLYNKDYDLPQEMAIEIAKKYNLEYNKILVEKIKRTKNQHDLSQQERKDNLKNAFRVNQEVKGKNVVIIDDIVTTGCSMEEVATTLKRKGANKVIGIAFAYNR